MSDSTLPLLSRRSCSLLAPRDLSLFGVDVNMTLEGLRLADSSPLCVKREDCRLTEGVTWGVPEGEMVDREDPDSRGLAMVTTLPVKLGLQRLS